VYAKYRHVHMVAVKGMNTWGGMVLEEWHKAEGMYKGRYVVEGKKYEMK